MYQKEITNFKNKYYNIIVLTFVNRDYVERNIFQYIGRCIQLTIFNYLVQLCAIY